MVSEDMADTDGLTIFGKDTSNMNAKNSKTVKWSVRTWRTMTVLLFLAFRYKSYYVNYSCSLLGHSSQSGQ